MTYGVGGRSTLPPYPGGTEPHITIPLILEHLHSDSLKAARGRAFFRGTSCGKKEVSSKLSTIFVALGDASLRATLFWSTDAR